MVRNMENVYILYLQGSRNIGLLQNKIIFYHNTNTNTNNNTDNNNNNNNNNKQITLSIYLI